MPRASRQPSNISLVLADVDGTLLTPDKVLTTRARDAVRALHAAGVAFAITSGRPPRGMAMLVEPLALRTPIAGFNGGVFVRPDMAIIEQRVLAPEVARRAVELIARHRMDVWVYCGNDWYIGDPQAPHVAREQRTVQFPPTVVAELDPYLDRAAKIVGVSDDHALVARCEADARRALGDEASAVRSQPYYLDVTHRDANKGAVVDALARILSIPPQEIATIGDSQNDVLMFRRGGLAIAMGNASGEVKAQAQCVTDSNEAEGFANALERFVLSRAPARTAAVRSAR